MEYAESLDHRSMQAILAPSLSLLALILCVAPMIWHVSNRNWGASFLVGFVIYSDIVNIINALIWPTDDVDSWWDGSGFCDIQVKLDIATQVGMPGALVCVFRSLAMAMSVETTALVPSRAQRIRNKAIDVFFCIGLPVLAMIAHYIVQQNRYYIFAIAGCNPSFDNSWPTIVLSWMWPLAICVVASCYCVLILIRLIKYTSEFSAILGARNKLTKQRFIRLFGIAAIMILIIMPLQVYIFYENIVLVQPLAPYSWNGTHGENIKIIIKLTTNGQYKYDRWIPVALSALVFAFFGLGQDAANMYRSFLNAVGLNRISTPFSSHATKSFHEGKSDSWYGSLRSRGSSWLLGGKRTNTAKHFMSGNSSHTDTTMSGGLDRDVPVHAAGPYEVASSIMQTSEFVVVHEMHPKNDCNV